MPVAQHDNDLNKEIESECKKARILIVEDDAAYREFLYHLLSKEGYTHIEQATNGREGYEKTLSYKPEIVILDLAMPVWDGVEYCTRIRAHDAFAHIPILVQTGVGKLELHQKSFQAGATDLLTKPINAVEFLARVHAHLERHELFLRLQGHQEGAHSELHTADIIQRSFMPGISDLESAQEAYKLKISSFYKPSGNVGGDLWGILPLTQDEALIYACDFSSKGALSTLQIMQFQRMFNQLLQETTDPAIRAAETKCRVV